MENPLLFAVALAVYWAGLWLHTGEPFPQSPWPYFTYYAQALLAGQLHFEALPPATLDLAFFEQRVYMHQPPFPAVVLAPFVALFGLDLADRVCAVLLGALDGVALYALLGAWHRRGLADIPESARVFLSVFFLFGTVHCYLAITGNPWELAHVVCSGLVALALLLCLQRHYSLAALAYVAVLFTRTHVFLSFPVLLGLYWILEGREGRDFRARRRGLLGMATIAAAGVGLLLAFNFARFADPFESGVSHHLMHETFRARFAQYGYFHWSYLPRNLEALLLRLPELRGEFPFVSFSPRGLSLFIVSPLYLYLLVSLRTPTRRLAGLLWSGVALVALPILLVMGTGEVQFGHRYSSDLAVFLILLAWLGSGMRVTRVGMALLGLSLVMNAIGTAWFVSNYAG